MPASRATIRADVGDLRPTSCRPSQPVAVVADTDSLNTLADRELSAGLAEVIKYGLIVDADFLAWLERHVDDLLAREPAALAHAIRRSCEIKAQIVEEDEREHGRRALLNLGHTFGHAIEAAMGYGRWLHGEAVAAGTVMALDLSVRTGLAPPALAERGTALLARAGLPVRPPPELAPDTFLDFMHRDKKVSDGALRLILVDGTGSARVTADVDPEALRATLERFHSSADMPSPEPLTGRNA